MIQIHRRIPGLSEITRNADQALVRWPSDHIGWRLQVQTNALNGSWKDVAGSAIVDHVNFPMDAISGAVFLRMIYP